MTGLLSKTDRITRIALVAVPLGALLVVTLGASAGATIQCDHSHPARCVTPVASTFRLSLSPTRGRILAGSTARYTIAIRRRRFPAAIRFRLVGRLPRGLTVRFSRGSTRGRRVTLVVRTNSYLAPRRYRLKVRAKARRVTRTATLIVTIVRDAGAAAAGYPAPYSIGGSAAGPLEPGDPQPLDLQITNPNGAPLRVASLSVAIEAIQAPHATATLPCSAADFALQQYSGPQPLVVPASTTSSLAALGVAPAAQPQISLLDLPSNQDGCQGASVTLSYTASATTG